MEFISVKNGDITVGKPIPWNAFDKSGILLLRKGQIIESARQLETLINRGLFHLEGQNRDDSASIIKAAHSPFELLDLAKIYLEQLFKNVTDGATDGFLNNVSNLCKKIMDACDLDEDACIGNIFLGMEYSYTIKHPVHVAIICELITRNLKWQESDRLALLAAAITSNIAMLNIQEKLFSQKDPLTDEQRQAIQDHPEHGVETLCLTGVTEQAWIDGVLHHHEAIDGGGYPSGLSGNAIPEPARIIAVGDHYCAAVSNRAYRSSLTPQEAMRELYLNAGKRTAADIVNMCIKLVGIYPPGTIVRLANGEIGVVTHRGEKAHLPVVHSVVKANGNMFLSPVKRDCSKEEYAIKDVILKEQLKININPYQLWGYCDLWNKS
ncbi:MAG: HD domain-containing protein [Nitrospirae bacterium]|nr:HD domain-containing protein [Nitrospirota bacterium]